VKTDGVHDSDASACLVCNRGCKHLAPVGWHERVPDGQNKFNDKWDGTYKVDDPHLEFWTVALHMVRRPLLAPELFFQETRLQSNDGSELVVGKPHYLTNCRRYPYTGLCSVGLFDANVVDVNTRNDEMICVASQNVALSTLGRNGHEERR
jgi:hypothetical protein